MKNVGEGDVEDRAQGRARDGNRLLFYNFFVMRIFSLCVYCSPSKWDRGMLMGKTGVQSSTTTRIKNRRYFY